MLSIDEIAREEGLQSDNPETNPPVVDTAANGDLSITYPDRFIRFTVKSISKQTRELNCVISVDFKPDPAAPQRTLLADTRLNLMSASAKQGVARSLKARRQEEWPAMIEEVAAAVHDNWQSDEPAVLLEDIEDPGPTEYLVKPFLQTGEHTVIFGKGGSGKSLAADATGLTVASNTTVIPGLESMSTGPALYLDWERTSKPHRRRFQALKVGAGISECRTLHYKRMTGLLADAADDIKRYVGEHGIELVIADSVGMACGGLISDEAAVIAYFNAARVIGATWLSIAHVRNDESNGRPIGSQYWYTQPQGGTYELIGDTEEGQNTLHLTLIHRKTNDERNPTLAWRVTFDQGRITFAKADPVEVATDQRKLPVSVRLKAALLGENNRTAKELAEELGIPADQIINGLKRSPTFFGKIGSGRPQRWALLVKPQPELPRQNKQLSDNSGGLLSGDTPLRGDVTVNDNSPEAPVRNTLGNTPESVTPSTPEPEVQV